MQTEKRNGFEIFLEKKDVFLFREGVNWQIFFWTTFKLLELLFIFWDFLYFCAFLRRMKRYKNFDQSKWKRKTLLPSYAVFPQIWPEPMVAQDKITASITTAEYNLKKVFIFQKEDDRNSVFPWNFEELVALLKIDSWVGKPCSFYWVLYLHLGDVMISFSEREIEKWPFAWYMLDVHFSINI